MPTPDNLPGSLQRAKEPVFSRKACAMYALNLTAHAHLRQAVFLPGQQKQRKQTFLFPHTLEFLYIFQRFSEAFGAEHDFASLSIPEEWNHIADWSVARKFSFSNGSV